MSDQLPEGVKALRDVTSDEEYQLTRDGTWFHGTMKKHPSWGLGRFVLVRPRRDLWVATAKNVADLLNKAAGT